MKTMRPGTFQETEESFREPIEKIAREFELATPALLPSPAATLLRFGQRFPGLRDTTTIVPRLALAMMGFIPVTLIAASTFDIVGLRDLATHVLLPAIAVVVLIIGRYRWAGRFVLRAMIIGALATGLYDLIRFGFLWAGFMHVDPIPHIGVALHLRPAWMVGYLWRYGANGAGLSIAFFSLGFTRIRQGLLYGAFVALGLISVLVVSPHAQDVLWTLTPISATMIVIGHLAFGAGLAIVRQLLGFDPTVGHSTGQDALAARPCPPRRPR
jgi:hypothetical protein